MSINCYRSFSHLFVTMSDVFDPLPQNEVLTVKHHEGTLLILDAPLKHQINAGNVLKLRAPGYSLNEVLVTVSGVAYGDHALVGQSYLVLEQEPSVNLANWEARNTRGLLDEVHGRDCTHLEDRMVIKYIFTAYDYLSAGLWTLRKAQAYNKKVLIYDFSERGDIWRVGEVQEIKTEEWDDKFDTHEVLLKNCSKPLPVDPECRESFVWEYTKAMAQKSGASPATTK